MQLYFMTIVCCGGTLLAAPQFVAAASKAGEIKTEKRLFKMKSGAVIRYEIGTLYVRENRSDPKSRLIGFSRFVAVRVPR